MLRMTTTIQKIVDCILLNSCSVNSSGLYNGKAGMALALFEAARFLHDDYIEEQAFNLLQEALITKTEDISFENGLSGIGYVLLYLAHDNFIDADFNDLFGDQHQKVMMRVGELKGTPNTMLRLNYYLAEVRHQIPDNHQTDKLIRTLFEATELDLHSQFSGFNKLTYNNDKKSVLSKFECYMKTVCDCGYKGYSHSLLNEYANLYRSGYIKSSFTIASYLEMLRLESIFNDVICANKQHAIQSDLLQHCDLRNLIEFSQLSKNEEIITSITSENESEKAILNHIPMEALTAGYEHGLSRLLIYLTNKKTILS